MSKFVSVFLLSFLFSGVAVAETLQCEGWWCPFLENYPQYVGAIVAISTCLSLVLRAVSDLLLFIGKSFSSDDSTAIGNKLASYSIMLAKVIGWFGVGTPKAILEEKIKKNGK